MKTTLPERSRSAKERLDRIVTEILAVGEKKIAMIILFGSYARGDWVQDMYVENMVTYSYQSDFDLLIVLKKGNYGGYLATKLKSKIQARLERRMPSFPMNYPANTLILEPINRINEELRKGQYFFCDIIEEGVMLYDSCECQLSEVKRNVPWIERKPIAEEDYKYWFKKGSGFLLACIHQMGIEDNELAAFQLHQATESLYNAILLVFSGYKPKEHDISELVAACRVYSN